MLNIIFPKKSPLVNGYSFDAVLEDTLEMSIELTRYPIESGVNVNDHRIINPTKYYITGVYGSKPIKPLISLDSFNPEDLAGIAIGAATNLFRDNPLVAAVGGLSAGWLAGSQETRAATALEFFVNLMRNGFPFTVDAVDRQLTNMVITKLSRTKDNSNETGMILVLELQELITLDRINAQGGIDPTPDQLIDGDPSQTSCSRDYHRGQQVGDTSVSPAVATAVTQSVITPTPLPPLQ